MQTPNHVSFYACPKLALLCRFGFTLTFWGGQWCERSERSALKQCIDYWSCLKILVGELVLVSSRPWLPMWEESGLLESVINRLPLIQANNPLSRFRRMWRSVCCHHHEILLLLLMWRRKRRKRRTRGVDQKHLHADKSSRSIQRVLKTQLTMYLLGKDFELVLNVRIKIKITWHKWASNPLPSDALQEWCLKLGFFVSLKRD